MPFEIVRNDIVNMQVDAVVNTVSRVPVIGYGVDSSINEKAGPKLLKARKKVGDIDFGDAIITPGYLLDAKYVIHTVGPVWQGGNHSEEKVLSSCYKRSLELAKKYRCDSVAFPLIATGNYGFPKSLALKIAINEIGTFLLNNEMQVYLVVFDKESFVLSEKIFNPVRSYIDENYIKDRSFESDSGYSGINRNRFLLKKVKETRNNIQQFLSTDVLGGLADESPTDNDDLGELLENLDAGFSETLLKLIDRTGKKDSQIYRKANVDRKLFSKIRNNMDYRPSKTTALAFAFALELNLEETKDFIGRAGFALSHSSVFDVIVEYYLKNKNYDIFELNAVLFEYDQPLIGV
ncbi:MAG: macro domain-containing protein [Erysipelotrichia bacterium]|nr:macro domain-containing protein [Erysipelotrichia bacterium]